MANATRQEIAAYLKDVLDRHNSTPYGYLENIIHREYLDSCPEENWVDFKIVIPPEAANTIGTVHGGYIAAISDESMGLAALAMINDPDYMLTTLDFQMNTLRAMHIGEVIRLHCTMEHVGSRTVLCHGVFYRGDEICAMTTENYARIPTGKIKFSQF